MRNRNSTPNSQQTDDSLPAVTLMLQALEAEPRDLLVRWLWYMALIHVNALTGQTHPSLFIIYARGNKKPFSVAQFSHGDPSEAVWLDINKHQTARLAQELSLAGCQVRCDLDSVKQERGVYTDIQHYIWPGRGVADAVRPQAETVLVCASPLLREKYQQQFGEDGREYVVYSELSALAERLRHRGYQHSAVTLLTEGRRESAFPPFIGNDAIWYDARREEDWTVALGRLLTERLYSPLYQQANEVYRALEGELRHFQRCRQVLITQGIPTTWWRDAVKSGFFHSLPALIRELEEGLSPSQQDRYFPHRILYPSFPQHRPRMKKPPSTPLDATPQVNSSKLPSAEAKGSSDELEPILSASTLPNSREIKADHEAGVSDRPTSAPPAVKYFYQASLVFYQALQQQWAEWMGEQARREVSALQACPEALADSSLVDGSADKAASNRFYHAYIQPLADWCQQLKYDVGLSNAYQDPLRILARVQAYDQQPISVEWLEIVRALLTEMQTFQQTVIEKIGDQPFSRLPGWLQVTDELLFAGPQGSLTPVFRYQPQWRGFDPLLQLINQTAEHIPSLSNQARQQDEIAQLVKALVYRYYWQQVQKGDGQKMLDRMAQEYHRLPPFARDVFLTELQQAQLRLLPDSQLKSAQALRLLGERLAHQADESGWRLVTYRSLQQQRHRLRQAVQEPEATGEWGITVTLLEEQDQPVTLPLSRAWCEALGLPDRLRPKAPAWGGRHYLCALPSDAPEWMLKLYPEQPGLEWASSQFTQRCVGHGSLTLPELIKITLPDRSHLWGTLTPYHSGPSLSQVIEARADHRTELARLNKRNFTQHVLRILLTNPEDDRPDDYVWCEEKDGTASLIRLDNERVFFQALSAQGIFNRPQLNVRSIIYLLPNFYQTGQLDSDLLADFCVLEPYSLLSAWLEEVRQWQEAWLSLTRAESPLTAEEVVRVFRGERPPVYQQMMKTSRTVTAEHCLLLPGLATHPKPLTEELLHRIVLLQEAISTAQSQQLDLCGWDLLRASQPALAEYYYKIWHGASAQNPIETFFKTVGKNYLLSSQGYRYSQLPGIVALTQSLHLPQPLTDQEVAGLCQGQPLSVQWAHQQFQETRHRFSSFYLKQLKTHLFSGDRTLKPQLKKEVASLAIRHRVSLWQALRQSCVEQQLTPEQITLAFKQLVGLPFVDLTGEQSLTPFGGLLTDRYFKLLLQGAGAHLLALEIQEGPHLTDASLRSLSQDAVNLRILILANLPQLEYLEQVGQRALSFNALQRLQLEQCGQLKRLILRVPRLEVLQIHHHEQLSKIQLTACPTLNTRDIDQFSINDCPQLERIQTPFGQWDSKYQESQLSSRMSKTNEFGVLVTGHHVAAGHLVDQFLTGQAKENYYTNYVADNYYKQHLVDGQPIRFCILLASAEKNYLSLWGQRALRYEVMILVLSLGYRYDLIRKNFESIFEGFRRVKDDPSAPIIIVGVWGDSPYPREINYEEASLFAKYLGASDYLECNPLTGENVDLVFTQAAQLYIQYQNRPIKQAPPSIKAEWLPIADPHINRELKIAPILQKRAERLSLVTSSTPSKEAASSSPFTPTMADERVPEEVKQESLALAQQHGKVGPRFIENWQLRDVADDGNCFYEAVADQMQLIQHDFLRVVPAGTAPKDSLRLRVQGPQFQDREWADIDQIVELARIFRVIVAIVDTRVPLNGFVYHYIQNDGNYDHTTDYALLPAQPLVRLAYTGNHYLSVIQAAGEGMLPSLRTVATVTLFSQPLPTEEVEDDGKEIPLELASGQVHP